MPSFLDWRRRWRLRRAPQGPLRSYLQHPFPPAGTDYREVEYLAIDLETTGLDCRRDLILSVGYVTVRGISVDLSTARHRLVRIDRAIPEASAVIHQITDDQSARGQDLAEVVEELLEHLAGKVMIAHHAHIEQTFLSNACKQCWGKGLLMPVIDTQELAFRTFERRQIPFKPSDLRLHALGHRYNLPRYGAHNALSDSIAAAELFLAQAAYRDDGRGMRLADFLC
ncbi:exonuclease domain-containing protein [Imhoffiella purpurea]|uniref:DNA polymerase III epsilon subunit n=1 Tax=Imhoffiella purpurea TaxID=1249627 RepID=W9VG22_9GAMM|nr:exonuclease domain-containing protein [Imhoffiella purpurea]EXJ14987.1 DNA polymerase III epsilon subunit [Imhoffiella purpurea]